jgi:hypothetical protein
MLIGRKVILFTISRLMFRIKKVPAKQGLFSFEADTINIFS